MELAHLLKNLTKLGQFWMEVKNNDCYNIKRLSTVEVLLRKTEKSDKFLKRIDHSIWKYDVKNVL